jgi:hypothetical protein
MDGGGIPDSTDVIILRKNVGELRQPPRIGQ